MVKNQTKICYIFAAGEYDDAPIKIENPNNCFIVAADGGYEYLKLKNITPNLIVGDFDSLGYIPKGDNTICHPEIKDDTDLMLAVKEGFAAGCSSFIIYGALGGRLDHTLANIQLLIYIARHGGKAFLRNNEIAVTAIYNESIFYSADYKGVISVFCIGGNATGVTIKGLKYEISNSTLTACYPLGISNEFIGKQSEISVEKGSLIIICENQDK